jgi:hypothetical protein
VLLLLLSLLSMFLLLSRHKRTTQSYPNRLEIVLGKHCRIEGKQGRPLKGRQAADKTVRRMLTLVQAKLNLPRSCIVGILNQLLQASRRDMGTA